MPINLLHFNSHPLGSKTWRPYNEFWVIKTPKGWERLDKIILEAIYGKLPPRTRPIYIDGNRKNCTSHNLTINHPRYIKACCSKCGKFRFTPYSSYQKRKSDLCGPCHVKYGNRRKKTIYSLVCPVCKKLRTLSKDIFIKRRTNLCRKCCYKVGGCNNKNFNRYRRRKK